MVNFALAFVFRVRWRLLLEGTYVSNVVQSLELESLIVRNTVTSQQFKYFAILSITRHSDGDNESIGLPMLCC